MWEMTVKLTKQPRKIDCCVIVSKLGFTVTVHGQCFRSIQHNSWEISISVGYLTCFKTSLTRYSDEPIFGVGLGLQPISLNLNPALYYRGIGNFVPPKISASLNNDFRQLE